MTLVRATLVLSTVILFALPAMAFAQGTNTGPELTDEERQEARTAFSEGQAAFEAGEFEVALARFERSYELVPHSNTLFNTGRCLEALERWVDAFRNYHHIISDPDAPEEAIEQATRLRDALQDRVSLVALSQAEGDSVEARLEAETEFAPLPEQWAVEPGPVTFVLRRNTEEWRRSVDAAFGNVVYLEVEPPAREVVTNVGITERPERPTLEAGALTYIGGAALVLGTAGSITAWTIGGNAHDDFIADGSICMNSTCETGRATNVLTWVGIGVAAVGGVLMLVDLLFVEH